MLTVVQILTRLYELPEEFDKQYEKGEWCAASMTYETALLVSGFIELDTDARDKLMDRFDKSKVINAFRCAGWYREDIDADRRTDRKKAV